MTTRPINHIAGDIVADWGWHKVNYAARPYLEAMLNLESPNDKYFQDDARSVVRYFLANARTFKGEQAKALKAELKATIGDR